MKLFWTAIRIGLWINPRREMACVENDRNRRALLLETRKRLDDRLKRSRLFKSTRTAVPFLLYIGAMLALETILPPRPTGIELFDVAIWVFVPMLATIPYVIYTSRKDRLVLRQCMCDFGYKVCLHCGYELKGLTEPRCPECGRTFDPSML